jgi:colicin import membrane protein
MSSSGLFAELKKHPWILALVILVHLGLALLLGLNLSNDEAPPMPSAQKHKIIDAVVVDANKYDERVKKKERLKKQAVQKKIDDKKAAEKKKRLALKKKVEEKKVREKKAREKKVVEKKAAEKKKLAIAKKKKQEKLKKEKLAKKKQAEKKAKEKKAREKKERERIAAEKKRKAEEERKRRAEEKAELKRAVLEEERREEEARKQAARAARLQTQRQQYIMLIAQKVENNWLRPVSTTSGQSCDVIVRQTMSGDVIDVRVQSCTSDNAFQRSVERAVQKASPLPLPPDPELFDREIYFKFKPRT